MHGFAIEVEGFGATNRCLRAKLLGWVVVLICALLYLISTVYQKLYVKKMKGLLRNFKEV